VSVPSDLSVVGFDDVPEAAYFSPPLTSVRMDFEQVGRDCVSLLLGLITEPRSETTLTVPPVPLVIRGSTGAPRE
jgi:DNA-binding LacI/PurR family transcriptional regulator